MKSAEAPQGKPKPAPSKAPATVNTPTAAPTTVPTVAPTTDTVAPNVAPTSTIDSVKKDTVVVAPVSAPTAAPTVDTPKKVDTIVKGKPAPANPELAKKNAEKNADQQLIDANFAGKTFKLKSIFTEEEANGKYKRQIDKLRNLFSHSKFSKDGGGMDIEDAAIVRRIDPTTKVETKYIQVTLDNDGVNQDLYKNIQIPYDKVVKDGKLDGNAYREALRTYFVIDVFPKI